MSFSVRRNDGDKRQLGKFAKPMMALVDMIAEKDWERVITLTEAIAEDARVEILCGEKTKAPKTGLTG